MIRLFDILKSREFHLPLGMFFCIAVAFFGKQPLLFVVVILIGIVRLGVESRERLKRKKWNLDYLAFLTLIVAFVLDELLTGSVIAFMVVVSSALERYGTARAEKTLRELFEKIPKMVLLKHGKQSTEVSLQSVQSGDVLVIRPNEMLAFDGYVLSDRVLINEANLTGEMEPVVYKDQMFLKSGMINVGTTFDLRVQGDFEHSSYRKILNLVEEGKAHPSPVVRLAERYNLFFTGFALMLACGAYLFFNDWERFLAVLVIATPCPLLIAAPISFIGGINKAARKNIIIKSPYVLELLAKTKTFFFDKTGTLTLGEPSLKKVELLDPHLDKDAALAIAAAIEWHSFHPLAKSIVKAYAVYSEEMFVAENVEEIIGEGIFGTIAGKRYGIVKAHKIFDAGIVVDLLHEQQPIARFFFDDELKENTGKVFDYLRERGYALGILTGDRRANASRLFGHFKIPLYAECSPEKKIALVTRHQNTGALVGMIGDGMNDAPALAAADVGIVFSGTENSASTEAADVAILSRDVWLIRDAIHIGRRSYHVAVESIIIGIGLSSLGMIAAFFGFIPPVYGAILQEVIDGVVIINALRSTY